MRFIDKYVGTAIIHLLVLLQTAGFPYRKGLHLQHGQCPNQVLIQKFFGIGSIVNTIPLINQLRENYPDVHVTFITFQSNVSFLEFIGIADEIISVDDSNFTRFVKTTLLAIYCLNRKRFDICIDLEFFSNYSMIISFLSRAPIRAGFFAHFNLRSKLLTHPTSFNHYKHISRVYLSMAEALGIGLSNEDCHFQLPRCTPVQQKQVHECFDLPVESQIIVVNPNASPLCNLRKWPKDKFVRLIKKMLDRYRDHIIVLIGSPSERDYAESIVVQWDTPCGRLVNAAGRTSIKELLVLLESCDALISNDSGPIHIAAGFATPTVGLYGPETPIVYGPCNPNAISLYKELYCSPCINVLDNKSYADCSEIACMNSITVDEVLNALNELIQETRA